MNVAERISRLKEVVEKNKNSVINIFIAQVDPDAIGSALGLYHILLSMDAKAAIWYCGGIGHPQNRSIINRYDLLNLMKPIVDLKEKDLRCALVDSSALNDARLTDVKLPIDPLIIIDHHRDGGVSVDSDDTFVWIEDMGSACTMIIELMMEMKLELPDQYKYIPVLLAMGIYSDTKKLVGACDRDISAYNYISRQILSSEFNALINFPLPDTYYANLSKALSHSEIDGSRLVTHIGKVTAKQGDDLSTIADILIRRDSITLVVVWGIVDGKVRFSARNNDITTPLDDLLRECFGEKSGAKLTPDGRGEGGGLIDLDFGFFGNDDALDEIIALIKKRMETVIFAAK